jgi:hypothetical protein
MAGGKKAVAHQRFEAEARSGSKGGGQRDPATTREREESEGPTGQWKATIEATLTRVGEDGAGTTEMPSIVPHSGACGWVRRQGKRGCCSCGRVRERTGKKEGAGAAAGAF